MTRLSDIMLAQRGSLFEWSPVCLGMGIGTYFMLRFEPDMVFLVLAGVLALLALLSARWLGEAFGPLSLGIALAVAGFLLAAHRAHDIAGPVIGWRYYGPIEGRVVEIDRSASDALRLTLDRVVLERVSADETPLRVRISLHGDQSLSIAPEPGMRVMTTGHLSPPGGPVEPGGFDFQRHAWFQQLGAVGYTRVPLVALEIDENGLSIFRLRMAASERILQTLPGDVGGFAVAVTTGARSAIGQEALDDLRASNLAHLLAISGLHMGLLTGFIFAVLRIGIALVPPLALRVPGRKLAAAGALVAATGYLLLSGGNVATERAYVMVAVALGAVMVDRRAISLRSVAIAALIVLVLRPEALMGPGFQMSFAATTALVAIFGLIRDKRLSMGPGWAKPVVAVLISSGVAGLATAPIGAAHFNAISHYGLLANLLSVPVMGAVVVPAAVLALCLLPVGLADVGLWIMGLGLRWILEVGSFVAGLDGARSYVPGPGPAVLPLVALGFLWLVLWQGRLRFLGAATLLSAFVLWGLQDRPAGLIAEDGALVGFMTADGRALSKPKGAGFVAQNWLENDGDASSQEEAHLRWHDGALFGDGTALRHLAGKKAAQDFRGCRSGEIVVANHRLPDGDAGCEIYDPARLATTGAVALYLRGGKLQTTTVRDISGDRLWSRW